MIGEWTVSTVAEVTQGVHACGDAGQCISGVGTDTRKALDGMLFVALTGPSFDGNDYLGAAVEQGAAAALVSRIDESVSLPQILVEDTTRALGLLGAENRRRFRGCTLALTGSVGKTTVKELTAAILRGVGQTRHTQGNLNNHLGAPLSLLALDDEDCFGVFELGANHAGEIAYTVSLVKPDVAVLINAADAHLEGFGSRDGVARAKAEIFAGLSGDGCAVLNRDSEYYDFWAEKVTVGKRLTFGVHEAADVRASAIDVSETASEFVLHVAGETASLRLPLPGAHNVRNALAATALAHAAGAGLQAIVAGLSEAAGVQGRLNTRHCDSGARLIDDTYNASPTSVLAALDVLSAFAAKRIAVLGNMAELGEASETEHERVGRYARERVDCLLVMGPCAGAVRRGFGADDCILVSSHDEAVKWLRANTTATDTILVKGSRSAAMEKVVNGMNKKNITEKY